MTRFHLYLAVIANVQLRVEGKGPRVLAPLGVAGVPTSWPEASTAHQGVVNVAHHLQQKKIFLLALLDSKQQMPQSFHT